MTIKTKAAALFKRMLTSRLLAIAVLVGVCYGMFSFVAAAATVVEIHDGDTVFRVVTLKKDPQDILEQADIKAGLKDVVDLSRFNGEDGSIIRIHRNRRVEILNGETRMQLDTIAETVADALDEAGFQPEEGDAVLPSLQTKLFDGMHISYDKIRYTQRVEQEQIPYDVQQTPSDEMVKGSTKRISKGELGEKSITYSDKYINDLLTETVVLSEEVLREAVAEQVLVGTKEKPAPVKTVTEPSAIAVKSGNKISQLSEPEWLELDENGLPVSYSRVIEGKATAYSPNDGTITSTGLRAQPGYIAVNPDQIPYGTKMYIVSTDGRYVYGYAIAADTGGFAKSGSAVADLFFNSHDECIQFGRRSIRIYILE